MKKWIPILAFFLVLIAGRAYGQYDLSNKAIRYYQNDKLDSARMLIDSALGVKSLRESPSTWHYRGFIYKDVYQKLHNKSRSSPARDTAIESIKKSSELDTADKYTEANKKVLKYFAQTYYNDAVKTMDTAHYNISRKMYRRYKEVMKEVDPDHDFTGRDIQYYESLGSILFNIWFNSKEENQEIFRKAQNVYEKLLRIDPDNPVGNEVRGKLYYNKGVKIVKNLDPDETNISTLKEKQEEFRQLLRKALPFMEKCHELQPENLDCIEGLMGIYYGLNENEKYQKYKKLKEEQTGEGKKEKKEEENPEKKDE